MIRQGINEIFDYVIVGLGPFGLSIALELKIRGYRVFGIDAASPGNRSTLSYGETRLFRQGYLHAEEFIPKTFAAYDAWLKVNSDFKINCIRPGGHQVCFEKDDQLISSYEQLFLKYDIPFDVSYLDICQKKILSIKEKNAFTIDVNRYLNGALSLLGDENYSLYSPLNSFIVHDDIIEMKLSNSSHVLKCKNMVIAAGHLSTKLLGEKYQVRQELVGQRAPVMWFKNKLNLKHSISFYDNDNHYFMIPGILNENIKIFNFNSTEVYLNPLEHNFELLEKDKTSILRFLKEKLQIDDFDYISGHACMYYCTPNDHFYLDSFSDKQNIFIATGDSGHAFKFAPLLGKDFCQTFLQQ